MKKYILILFTFVINHLQGQTDQAKQITNYNAYFEENRGQVTDEYYKPVNDVLYHANSNGTQVCITNTGLSYYFFQSDESVSSITKLDPQTTPAGKRYNWQRVDMVLENANIQRSNIVAYNQIGHAVFNYYLTNDVQITGLHRYQKLIIKNIYPGIDWILYAQGQKGIKYDFIVNPGADPNQIKISYIGAEQLNTNKDGGYTVKTSLGQITESAPVSFNNKNKILTQFKLHENNISFNLKSYNKKQTLIIDPALVWGTYLGGNYADWITDICTDNNNNLILAMRTFSSSNLPLKNMPGSYFKGQIEKASETFITKFNASGALLWGTYYGPLSIPLAITNDKNGYIYVTGRVDAPVLGLNTALKDPGNGAYFQSTYKGAGDAFISKFDSLGTLTWATLFGGNVSSGRDIGTSVTCDAANNLYLSGLADGKKDFPLKQSSNQLAIYDSTSLGGMTPFIAKFNNKGIQLWCTFLDNSGNSNKITTNKTGDRIAYCGDGGDGNDFKALKDPGNGATYNATAPGWPPQVMCEFDTSCVLTWGTYYGGSGWEYGTSAAYDYNNNLYVVGNGISTNFPSVNPGSGAFIQTQNTGGNFTGYILKFDANKKINWSTYLSDSNGGTTVYDIDIDSNNNVYCAGSVSKNTLPIVNDPSTLINQNTFGGSNYDGFVMRFDKNSNLIWSSYIGGPNEDALTAVVFDKEQCLYLGGYTQSLSGLPIKIWPGAFNQNSLVSTATDGYIAKLCPLNTNTITEQKNYNFFTVFPNPFSGGFQLRLFNEGAVTTSKLCIVNTLGEMLYAENVQLQKGVNIKTIENQKLSSGIYFISVEINGIISSQKIIKE